MELKISEQIQAYRKNLGMTQEQLAERMGVTNQAVSKWETNQSYPDIQLLPELAELFGITLDQLFGYGAEGRTDQPALLLEELPWEDDGNLRAVVFVGRTLGEHQRISRAAAQVELHFQGSVRDIHSEFAVICENSAIEGSVTAGDDVHCGDVGGYVVAGDAASCGNVGGSVTAGDGVSCGNVDGNVQAGDSVQCSAVGGSVEAAEVIRIQM